MNLKGLFVISGFYILSICFFKNKTFAQVSLQGRITDNHLNPVSYATIILRKDTMKVGAAFTDSLGRFTLINIPIGTYDLTAFYSSTVKTNLLLSLTNDSSVSIILNDIATRLNEVVVQGKRNFERISDRFVYFPAKEITEGLSGIELMRHVPLVLYDEKNNSFSMIGKTGTVVYLNNRRSDIPNELLLQTLRSIPASNIKSIELITNPGSEYHANTQGGVININLKKDLHEGWAGSAGITTQQGPFNFTAFNGFLSYRKRKVGVQILPAISSNYNYSTGKTYLAYVDSLKEQIDIYSYRRYSVLGSGLKFDYDINERSYLSYNGWFSYVSGKSHGNTLTAYSMLGNQHIDSSATMNTHGIDSYIYNFGNLNYHYKLNAEGDAYLDANVDYNHFFQRRKNEWEIAPQTPLPDKNADMFRSNLPQIFFNISGRFEYCKTFKKYLKLLAGFQISSTDIDNNLRYYFYDGFDFVDNNLQNLHYSYKEKYYAGYASISKKMKKWDAKVGLRIEGTKYSTEEMLHVVKADSSYINLFPNASVSFTSNPQNQFGLSYSRKIIRPNVELLFPGRTYVTQNYYIQNNPFLKATLSNIAELSYVLKKNYVFSLTYTNSANNFASFILPGSTENSKELKRTYYNYGKYNGVTVLINVHQHLIKDFWEFYLTPSYNYAKYTGTTTEVPVDITNNSFNLYWDNYIYFSKKYKWTCFVTFKYFGPNTSISAKRLNGTSSLDIQIRKVINDFSASLILSDIYNGTSKVNQDYYPNRLLFTNSYYGRAYNRSVNLTVRYSFGNKKLKGVKSRSSANEEIGKRL